MKKKNWTIISQNREQSKTAKVNNTFDLEIRIKFKIKNISKIKETILRYKKDLEILTYSQKVESPHSYQKQSTKTHTHQIQQSKIQTQLISWKPLSSFLKPFPHHFPFSSSQSCHTWLHTPSHFSHILLFPERVSSHSFPWYSYQCSSTFLR